MFQNPSPPGAVKTFSAVCGSTPISSDRPSNLHSSSSTPPERTLKPIRPRYSQTMLWMTSLLSRHLPIRIPRFLHIEDLNLSITPRGRTRIPNGPQYSIAHWVPLPFRLRPRSPAHKPVPLSYSPSRTSLEPRGTLHRTSYLTPWLDPSFLTFRIPSKVW